MLQGLAIAFGLGGDQHRIELIGTDEVERAVRHLQAQAAWRGGAGRGPRGFVL